MNIAIIFAGGVGSRMGAGIPKQFLEINGKPILVHTLDLFEYHNEIDKIYISTLEEYIPYVEELVKEFHISKVARVVAGGDSAQDSIYNGLKAAEEDHPGDSIVLIHDGVRPFITYETISNNINGVKEMGNAITSTACFETILISEDGGNSVDQVPYRKNTYAAQAPQSFYLKDILECHEIVRATPKRYTDLVDNCTLVKSIGKEVHMVEGNRGNIKVTTPEDVYFFRALLQYAETEQAFGMGNKLTAKIKRFTQKNQ